MTAGDSARALAGGAFVFCLLVPYRPLSIIEKRTA